MSCEDLREDYEAYALGALDSAQMRRIEEHIRDCLECSQAVRTYQIAVDELALAVPLYRAPPRLKQRIMGSVGVFRPAGFAPPFLRSRWVLGAAAAVLLALAVGGVAWAIILSSQVGKLQKDNEDLVQLSKLDVQQRSALLQLQGDLNSARNEQQRMSTTLDQQATMLVIALDPALIPTELEGTAISPQAHCNYVWSRNEALGVLTCKQLATTPFNQIYELWAVKGDKTLPLGAFLSRTDGSAQMLVKFPADADGPVSNLWITLEPQSGSRQRPTGEVVLQRAPAQQAAR